MPVMSKDEGEEVLYIGQEIQYAPLDLKPASSYAEHLDRNGILFVLPKTERKKKSKIVILDRDYSSAHEHLCFTFMEYWSRHIKFFCSHICIAKVHRYMYLFIYLFIIV